MPFNGSGVFTRLYDWTTDRDNAVNIIADRVDAETDGIVAGINDIVDQTQGFTGPVRGTNGTATAPAFSFTGDTNSGMYRVGADVLGFSVNGTLEMRVEGGYVDAVNGLKIGGTAVSATAAELNILDGVTATTAELNILDGVTATTAELNILDGVTATASELNALDGMTATTAELNILDGATITTAELNELGDFAGVFTLPAADGTNGQVLTTDGAGGLTFTTVSSGSTYTAGTGLDLTGSEFALDSATQTSLGLADTALQSGDNVSALTNDASYADADDIETTTINAETGTTYTLVIGDRGQTVTMDNSSANTVTIPTNSSVSFATGSVVTVIQKGAGATTIEGDTGVTVNGVSAGSVTISAQYQGVSLLKVATNTWIASGAI